MEVTFEWNDQCKESFQKLKMKLTMASVLTLRAGTFGYKIYAVASQKGFEFVLILHGKVITSGSRQLKPHEQN